MEQYADGFTVEYLVPVDTGASPGPAASPISSRTTRAPSPAASPSSASPEAITNVEFVNPISDLGDALDADHDDDAPLRFRTLGNILGDVDVPGLAERELAREALYLTSAEEPRTFKEAEQDPRWRAAKVDELKAIEENGTWELVPRHAGHCPIGLKWVFKVKCDEHGEIVRHKARLITKGYVQRQGIDFEEVFSPIVRIESVRLLLAVTACEGWEVHHMDVKTAFLNGEPLEEVYVEQAPGFTTPGAGDKVYHLKHALYSVRQAPRMWNAKLDGTLRCLGFKRSDTEHAVYVRAEGNTHLIVGMYVDDLVITGSTVECIRRFKEEMGAMFKMSDLGRLSYYLGIDVKQNAAGITICQSAYAKKILEVGGITGCNPCATPMETRLKLSKKSTCAHVDTTQYRSIVGSIRYLIHSQPDLMYSVGYVSRFMEEPREDHLAAVKRILRYVAGTLHLDCSFNRWKTGDPRLLGFSDSDMASDVDDRKSTTGTFFFLERCPISWSSLKQKVVALSSCEAKYIAAAMAACQGVWLARLLAEVRGGEPARVKINVDNKSAISVET